MPTPHTPMSISRRSFFRGLAALAVVAAAPITFIRSTKAWVTFKTSGAVPSGFQVTSIDHNGVGDYTINFTTAFSSTDYDIKSL